MRKVIVLFSAIFMVLFLAACSTDDGADSGDDNDVPTAEDEAENTDEQDQADDDNNDIDESVEGEEDKDVDDSQQAEDQADMKKLMDDLNTDELDIEISYGSDQEYEVEIDHHDNGDIGADVEDEVSGEDLDNDLDAFNKLYPLVKQLEIEQDTDKEEVIQQVLDVFDLEDNYEKFEVEIT